MASDRKKYHFRLIWRVAGKYGKWHDNMASGRKSKISDYFWRVSGKYPKQLDNIMASDGKSKSSCYIWQEAKKYSKWQDYILKISCKIYNFIQTHEQIKVRFFFQQKLQLFFPGSYFRILGGDLFSDDLISVFLGGLFSIIHFSSFYRAVFFPILGFFFPAAFFLSLFFQ